MGWAWIQIGRRLGEANGWVKELERRVTMTGRSRPLWCSGAVGKKVVGCVPEGAGGGASKPDSAMERTVVAAQPRPLYRKRSAHHQTEVRVILIEQEAPTGDGELRRHGRARGFRCCARTWSGGRYFLRLAQHQMKTENNGGPAQPMCTCEPMVRASFRLRKTVMEDLVLWADCHCFTGCMFSSRQGLSLVCSAFSLKILRVLGWPQVDGLTFWASLLGLLISQRGSSCQCVSPSYPLHLVIALHRCRKINGSSLSKMSSHLLGSKKGEYELYSWAFSKGGLCLEEANKLTCTYSWRFLLSHAHQR